MTNSIVPSADRGWIARPPALPRPLRRWLCDRGSLTRRLKARCTHFRVAPRFAGLGRVHRDETAVLHVQRPHHAYIRDVLLLCDGKAVVFAHSVLPRASLRGPWNGVARLGSRPLGEALFNNPRIRREPLRFRKLTPRHPLLRRIARCQPLAPQVLWARRSVFCLDGQPLLVTEVFLPGIESL